MIIVCYSLKTWGGAEKNLVKLVDHLTRHRNQKVILFSDKGAIDLFDNEKLEIISLPFELDWLNPLSFLFGFIVVSKRIYKEKKPISFYTFGPLFSFFGAALKLRHNNIQLLTSERVSVVHKPVRFFVWAARLFYWNRAKVITANTELTYRFLRAKYKEKEVVLVKNYFESPRVINKKSGSLIDCGKIKLIFSGRLVHQKCVQLIIECCYLLSQNGVEVVLHIYGIGPEEESLKSLSQKVENEHLNIRFFGFVETSDIPYHDYCALFLPSKYEGLNNTIIEALTHGTPVITSLKHKHEIYFLSEEVNCVFVSGSANTMAQKILNNRNKIFVNEKIIGNFSDMHRSVGIYLHDIVV